MRTILCALAALIIAGCWEAEPDQDTFGELRDQVASFPIEIKMVMGRWAANRVAYGYMLGFNTSDNDIGQLMCNNPDRPGVSIRVAVTVVDMLKCLGTNRTTIYKECLQLIKEEREDERSGGPCEWESFVHAFDPENVPHEFDAERATVDDITRALLGPPPPLEIQLLLMGLPGVMGPGGAFCIQSVDWACAPDPFSGPPGTSASSGGGDR